MALGVFGRCLLVLAAVAADRVSPRGLARRREAAVLVPQGGGIPLQSQLTAVPRALFAVGRGLASVVRRRPKKEPAAAEEERQVAVSHEVLRGARTLAGGFIVHMVLGTLYCWGNFIAYAPKSLQYFDTESIVGKQPDALVIVPLIIIFQTIGLPLGAELIRLVGQRATATLGGLTVALGVFLSSYATDLLTFMALHGACFGLGVGIGYTAPMSAGWTWFPRRKGLVNGLVLLGFGTGGFICNILGSKIVNPDSLAPPFPPSVTESFPKMLRTLATCYAGATLLGGSLLRPKPGATKAAKVTGVRKAVTSPTFLALYAIIAMTASAGLTSASIYKLFAATTFDDDAFLAYTGALGALSNGFGRLLWATAVDFVGFKTPFAAMLLIQAVNTALTPAMARTAKPLLFLLATCLSFFCLGGAFSMAPTCCAIAFGPNSAPKIYGYLFSAFALASLGGVQLAKRLVPIFGWTPVYQILAVASLIPLALLPYVSVR